MYAQNYNENEEKEIQLTHFISCLPYNYIAFSQFVVADLYSILQHVHHQSTVRKKMATGPFTYNALRPKTLKERIKPQRKIESHSNSTRAMPLD